jgi:hypothetical protein
LEWSGAGEIIGDGTDSGIYSLFRCSDLFSFWEGWSFKVFPGVTHW